LKHQNRKQRLGGLTAKPRTALGFAGALPRCALLVGRQLKGCMRHRFGGSGVTNLNKTDEYGTGSDSEDICYA